jgi:lysophospholipase L1-like esterase
MTIYKGEVKIVSNQWKDKTWYVYGTSMSSASVGEFVPVVEKLSGMKVVYNGIPGGSLTPDGFGEGNVKNAIMNLEDGKENADLITVEVLPNEGAVVGDIYDTDNESFCGCFNQCLRFLQEHTKAQIVVIIMIGGNDNPPEFITEKRKITQFEFAQKIELVAKLNSVPVINVFCESGFGYARVKNKDYQIDNIHWNKLGGTNMGNFVWSKLQNITPWEK